MKTSMLKSRTGAAVGKVTIEAFRRGLCGQALLPGNSGYNSARRIWNASIDKHPAQLGGLEKRSLTGDRGFESVSLQRRVCELSVPTSFSRVPVRTQT